MNKDISKLSTQIYKNDVLEVLENNYSKISSLWVNLQVERCNDIYASFKDHDKYLIVIYLIRKTLDFYSKNLTKLNFTDFYSENSIEIEPFNIIEISKNIMIPKESSRRKIIELEESGIIKKNRKKITIDKSTTLFLNPDNSIKRISRFLNIFSEILEDNKILQNKLSSEKLEQIIKNNYSDVWLHYYNMQIKIMLNWKKAFIDLETWHIWGVCAVHQHSQALKFDNISSDRNEFMKEFMHSNNLVYGVNAMSISEITGIPRATVVRKLNTLIKLKNLKINHKKQYTLNGAHTKKLIPVQNISINAMTGFATHVYNLAIL